MYQGKHYKKSRRRSRKSMTLLVSLLLLIGVTVGGAIAFLMDSDGPLDNKFTPSKVTTTVNETVSGDTKSNVSIMNTGDTEAWIRAAVVITWQDKDGNVYGQAPAKDTNYTIAYGTENDWVQGDDGFWYYTKPVAAGTSTGYLINSCKSVGNAPAAGYYLNVEIIGSGIQSQPDRVVETEWESGVSAVTGTGTGRALAIKTGGGAGQ